MYRRSVVRNKVKVRGIVMDYIPKTFDDICKDKRHLDVERLGLFKTIPWTAESQRVVDVRNRYTGLRPKFRPDGGDILNPDLLPLKDLSFFLPRPARRTGAFRTSGQILSGDEPIGYLGRPWTEIVE